MKHFFTVLTISLLFIGVSLDLKAQTPEGVNYQAIARDGNGKLLSNKSIAVKCIILKGASASNIIYTEIHNITTNVYGHFSLVVGQGSTSNNFSSIKWGLDEHHLKIEVDNGAGYVVMGTKELQSVPYSLYSKLADSVVNINVTTGNIGDISSSGATTGQVLKWNGTSWVPGSDVGGITTYSAGTGLNLTGTKFSAKLDDAIWNANKLQGNQVSTNSPTNGQVLTWNGTAWISKTPSSGGSAYNAGNGMTLSGTTFHADSNNAIWNANKFQGKAFDPAGLKLGQVIYYDGTKWIAKTENSYLAGNGVTLSGNIFSADSSKEIWNANQIKSIDVDITGLTTGQVISYNGTKWIPITPSNGNTYKAGSGLTLTGTTFHADSSNAIWNANKIQGIDVDTTGLKSGQLIYFTGTKWIVAPKDSINLWQESNNGGIQFTNGNVGIGNDLAQPNTTLHVQDSSTSTTTGLSIMTENYLKAGISSSPNFIAQRSVVFGNGGTNHRASMNIASGTGASNAFFTGNYSSASGSGAVNYGVLGITELGATNQSTGVVGTTRARSTFNIGVLAWSDMTNNNTNYGLYAVADSASTNYAGYFVGNVNYTGTLTNVSDAKLKYNVNNLSNATNLVMNLKPKSYYYKQDGLFSSLNLSEGLQFGFIAQELETVFPELVSNQVHMNKINTSEKIEYKAVNYIALIPILTQAIKEQQQKIETLEAKLKAYESLEERLKLLEAKIK